MIGNESSAGFARAASLYQLPQEEGLIGRMVGAMIRRSVRKGFHNVYWNPPTYPVTPPILFFCTHHGWYDGYLMYHVVTKLQCRSLDWIQEFDAFPLFSKVGGMPYRLGDPLGRAQTIRRTIHLMKNESRSLILFPEGILHYPPEVLPFGDTFAFLKRKVPRLQLLPVAISYQSSLQERPEAFIRFGQPLSAPDSLCELGREKLQGLLDGLNNDIRAGTGRFELLAKGTPSINESLGFNRKSTGAQT
ncbi:MAG: hypothetical protein MUC92_00700 [Fimbriimonadaceae bacterium]|jgi:1-acyl-sn-glycerol-3-phosphate acyltransferase|nr:hypothetical protein [Fimbriimonadaceae bacterium]